MTEDKLFCKDCRYSKGIGYDFWCGEGHTEYEVFTGETKCPYYEFHDWSKGIPNTIENKRFWCLDEYESETSPIVDEKFAPTNGWLCDKLNKLYEENQELEQEVLFWRNIAEHRKRYLND